MQFKEIVGQEALKLKFVRAIDEGRVPHAQLFTGLPGTGKLALAIAYAQYLMCTNRHDGDACGHCPACIKVQKLIHPDLHFVYPVNSSEKSDTPTDDTVVSDNMKLWRECVLQNPYFSETDWYDIIKLQNKQGIINTATASKVIYNLSLKSYESTFKVMIIWLPERMHPYAANKLLKLIEEPPQNTVFIMVSESPHLLLKTITSRTQLVKIPPLAQERIALALVDRFQVPPDHARDISRISNGSYGKALVIKDMEISEHFERYTHLMRMSYSKNYLELLNWAEGTAQLGREGLKSFVSYALRITRDSLMLNLGLDHLSFLMGEEASFGKKFAPFINQRNIYRIVAEFTHLNEHIAQNANANIVLSDFVIKMAQLINPI